MPASKNKSGSAQDALGVVHRVHQQIMECIVDSKLDAHGTHYVAISGGVDSMVLAHALHASEIEVHLLHVNHHRMNEAPRWQRICERFAKEMNIPISILDGRIDLGTNLEARLRDKRYQVLTQIASERPLWIAHHEDDQLEGFFLRLMRGSGVHGLISLVPKRIRGNTPIIRPFLKLNKKSLLEYADECNLLWLEDESNEDFTFTRNIWRQAIIPEIKQRFPQFEAAFAASITMLQRDREVLNEVARKWMGTNCHVDTSPLAHPDVPILNIEALQRESLAFQSMLIRSYIRDIGLNMPPLKRLDTFIGQIRLDNEAEIRLGEGALRCWKGFMYFVKSKPQEYDKNIKYWSWAARNANENIAIDAHKFNEYHDRLIMDFKTVGNKRVVHPNDAKIHTQLKKILSQSVVPPWQRQSLPCVYFQDDIIYVPNVYVHPDWSVNLASDGIKLAYIG